MRGAALPGMWTPAAAQPRALLALRPPRMGKGAVGPASAGPGSQPQAVGSVLMSGSPGAGVGMGTQVGAPALRSLPCSYIRDPSVGFRGGSPGPLLARRPLLPGSRCAGASPRAWGRPPPEKRLSCLVCVSSSAGGRRAHEALSCHRTRTSCPLGWSAPPALLRTAQPPPPGPLGPAAPRGHAWGPRAREWPLRELVVGTVV